ncbi:MAG: ADOP family duplicated permease [Gemmatimonadetes bacterium]|nr:ADOP family duplicated permease [Gemmatimonadota bacterium]
MTRRKRDGARRTTRVFDALLALYSPAFQKGYGGEMRRVFVESYDTISRGGSRWTRLGFLSRTFRGMLVSAVGSWFDIRRSSPASSPRVHRVRGTAGAFYVRDVVAGIAAIVRAPGFGVLCVAILGLGGAAVVTVGAVTHATLVRPLPYAAPDRVVIGWGSTSVNGQFRDVIAGSVAVDLIRRNRTFDALAAFKPDGTVLMQDNKPHVLDALTVTTEFFAALGIDPWLGRWFTTEEGFSGGEPVLVVSHAFWQKKLNADSSAVGRRITLDGAAHTVVGITGPDFYFPFALDVVVPLHEDVLATHSRTNYNYWLAGRLHDGVEMATASADLNQILGAIAEEDPRLANWSILIEPFQESVVQYIRLPLLAVLVAVGFVWLIAIVNVANLLLIRVSGRQHALAIRRALGASTPRLAALLLAEGATISLAGFAIALGLATVMLDLLRTVMPPVVPVPGSAAQVALVTPVLSWPVVVFATLVFVGGFAVFSAPVLWNALRRWETGSLQGNSRTQSGTRGNLRMHDALVAAELTLATLLLVGAGLSVRTTVNLLRADSGLHPAGVLSLYMGDFNGRPREDRVRFFDGVLREIEALPGVAYVGLNDYVPLQNEDDFEGVRFPDRPPPQPGQGPREEWRRVSADYFAAAGISLIRGRTFTRGDDETAPSVAVINRAFAAKYFTGDDPIGYHIRVTDDPYDLTEIVGVVDDVLRRGLNQAAPPVLYVPYQRNPRPTMAVFVRTDGDPSSFAEAVKSAIWRVDPGQPIAQILTLEDIVRSSIGVPRLTMQIVGALASLALVLAAVGVFGVMAYSVRMRRHELAIRVAVGATPRGIRALVVAKDARITALGLGMGLGLAFLLGNTIEGLLFGVAPADPVTFAGVGMVLATVSLLAAYIPARRASHVDPLESLRAE